MKKIIIITLLIVSLFVTGCGDVKNSLQLDAFKMTMEQKRFIVVDNTATVQYENETIEKYYVATKDDQSYQIEYYSFTSETAALAYYAKEKELLGASGAYSEINVSNFSKYTQTYNKKYAVLSRISNTIICVNTDIKYQEEVKTLLKDIGY